MQNSGTKSAENYKGSFLKDRPVGNIEDIKVIGRIQVLFGGRGVIWSMLIPSGGIKVYSDPFIQPLKG